MLTNYDKPPPTDYPAKTAPTVATTSAAPATIVGTIPTATAANDSFPACAIACSIATATTTTTAAAAATATTSTTAATATGYFGAKASTGRPHCNDLPRIVYDCTVFKIVFEMPRMLFFLFRISS